MSEKTHSMVVLFELSSLFVKILICDALSSRNLFNDMMHAKWMCHVLTQGIRTTKTFIKYKKCNCQTVSNVEFSMAKKTLNQGYPASTTHILQNFQILL